jgi:hypothetical protein
MSDVRRRMSEARKQKGKFRAWCIGQRAKGIDGGWRQKSSKLKAGVK